MNNIYKTRILSYYYHHISPFQATTPISFLKFSSLISPFRYILLPTIQTYITNYSLLPFSHFMRTRCKAHCFFITSMFNLTHFIPIPTKWDFTWLHDIHIIDDFGACINIKLLFSVATLSNNNKIYIIYFPCHFPLYAFHMNQTLLFFLLMVKICCRTMSYD